MNGKTPGILINYIHFDSMKKCYNVITWHYRVVWQPFRLLSGCAVRKESRQMGMRQSVLWIQFSRQNGYERTHIILPYTTVANALKLHQLIFIKSIKMDSTSRNGCFHCVALLWMKKIHHATINRLLRTALSLREMKLSSNKIENKKKLRKKHIWTKT